jgi:hypothetical protein
MAKNSQHKRTLDNEESSFIKSIQEIIASETGLRPYSGQERTSIEEDIRKEEVRAHKLANDDKQQDVALKRITLYMLFTFLAVETALIFAFAFLQGTRYLGFHLDEWSFKLLVSATLAQITGMLFVAVNYLFPKK